MSPALIYRCSPSIIWVRDADQTLVVDRKSERMWALRGAKAVIWDLLTVGYSYPRIVRMLSLVFSLSAEEAEGLLTDAILEWRKDDVLQGSGEAEDGQLDRQRRM
jgi:hypothetical protein